MYGHLNERWTTKRCKINRDSSRRLGYCARSSLLQPRWNVWRVFRVGWSKLFWCLRERGVPDQELFPLLHLPHEIIVRIVQRLDRVRDVISLAGSLPWHLTFVIDKIRSICSRSATREGKSHYLPQDRPQLSVRSSSLLLQSSKAGYGKITFIFSPHSSIPRRWGWK